MFFLGIKSIAQVVELGPFTMSSTASGDSHSHSCSGCGSGNGATDSGIFESIVFAGRPVPPVRRKRPKSKIFVSQSKGLECIRLIPI